MPVISVEDGQWLLSGPMTPMAKPGGHGAIWKLMRDEGIFAWLQQQVCGCAGVGVGVCVGVQVWVWA